MIRLLFFILSLPLFIFSYEHLGEGIFIEKNHRETKKKPRIAILSVIISGKNADKYEQGDDFSYEKAVSFGTRSKELYAKKLGYDFIVARKKLNSCFGTTSKKNLPAAWTKLCLISRFIDKYDWVFWTDADSAIVNFDIPLESFIDERYALIGCTEDFSRQEPGNFPEDGAQYLGNRYIDPQKGFINTGQVFYKNSKLAKLIIYEAWNERHSPAYGFEQDRINRFIIKNKLSHHVKVHPFKDFNCKPEHFKLGNFLVHMHGYHGDALLSAFNTFENRYGYIIDNEEEFLEEARKPVNEEFWEKDQN